MILDEVLDQSPGVQWDDIEGLAVAKQILQVRDYVTTCLAHFKNKRFTSAMHTMKCRKL